MQSPDLTPDEPIRLETLHSLDVLDTPIDERFERITRLARRSLGVDVAAVSLIDGGRQWYKSIQGLDVRETPRDVSFCGHTILKPGEILVVPDATNDPRFHDNPLVLGPMNVVFYAGCPLVLEGCTLGALCVTKSEPYHPTDDDLQVLRDLAALTVSELHSACAVRKQDSLARQVEMERLRSSVDSLTWVWNRRGIMGAVQEAVSEVHTSGTRAALAMIDLDHFKSSNDRHGHAVGDEILRLAARRMLAAVRSTDSVGRYGGDEFVVVFNPCSDEEAARGSAERVQSKFVSTPFTTTVGLIDIRASVGIAMITPDGPLAISELIDAADAAMYESKRRGGGRIVVAEGRRTLPV